MANGPNRPNRPIRPRQGAVTGRRKRRVVIDNAANRPRENARQARERQEARPPKQPVAPPTGPVSVPSGVTVKDLSAAMGKTVPDIIKVMMGLGKMVTITQSLSDEEVELIAAELVPDRELQIKHAAEEELEPEEYEDAAEDLADRPPVVTIMGHVDHGKTTLLDAIRETAVVETEAGGITQHIGAYQVEHNGRKITFLDTPGHEAFTAMRARGAKVTDIAVLVVAADDGVMPQTRESISHARAAEVPIVVAVNKIDLPDADPNRVRGDLAGEGLQPEDWGGEVQFADVSAKAKQNLDELLEKVLLVADAELELKANPKAEASGPIIESRLDVGRGPVATMLVQRGTLRVGDSIVAGDAWGRVRALYNYRGEKVEDAGPGTPVEILGFDHPPPAGEYSRVVESERAAPEVRVSVIHQGVGGITENDVNLAVASNAMVVGFNVRPSAEARQLAEREGVEIRTYRVIYQLTEDIEQALVGMLRPVTTEETIGEVEVRALFRVSRLGTIAGCYVTEGNVRRGATVRVVRDGTVIQETSVAQLKRFKDDVREVAEGFECGILLEGFNDVKEGDVLEVYETRQVERTDLSEAPTAPAAT